MKKFKSITILLAIFAINIYGQLNEKLLNDALKLGYNFRFDESLNILKEASKTDIDNPRIYLFISKIYVWQYLSDNSETSFLNFKKYAGLTLEKSEQILKNDKNNYNAKYCVYNIKGYKTLLFLLEGKYIDGIWNAKECLSSTYAHLSENTNDYDAYLWKGLFNFALSQIPSTFKYLLSLTGLKGDFVKGIEELEVAASKSNFNLVESKYYLSQIYSLYLDDYKRAHTILVELNKLYPDNFLISYSLASEKIKLNKINDAKTLLTEIDNKKSHYKKINSLTKFLLGDINYFNGEYNKAIKYYNDFIGDKIVNEYVPVALFRLAVIYKLQDNNKESNKYFDICMNMKPLNEEAQYYVSKSKIYANREITNNELKIIIIENLIKSGDYNKAISELNDFVKQYQDINSQISSNYFYGLVYFSTNQYNFAENYFNKVITTGSSNSYLTNFSRLYNIKINYLNNKYNICQKYLDEIENSESDYFNESIKLKTKYYYSKIKGK